MYCRVWGNLEASVAIFSLTDANHVDRRHTLNHTLNKIIHLTKFKLP